MNFLSLSEVQEELRKTRSALGEKDKELNLVKKSLSEVQEELRKTRNIQKQQGQEWKSVNQEYYSHTTKTETHSESHYTRTRQQIKTHCVSANSSMGEMEAFYKEKLNEARLETARKEEELKSLKDSLAGQLATSLKTGDTESMNNPVSKTRLTEMYEKLKLLQWPKVKDQLKSRKMNPKEAKDLIQKTFGNASHEMKRRRQQIEEMFQQSSSGPTPQKVKEYRQLTVQNLQMALFHTNKEELMKTGFPECLGEFPEEVKVDLRPLTSECYWLSCLMALNNPPLQPDWKNHVPGFDSWDIFPREIKPSVM